MKGCGSRSAPHIEWMTTEDKAADKAKADAKAKPEEKKADATKTK